MAVFNPIIPAEQDNEVSWYKAGAAGIASGILKVPEGVFSLAAELIDLGLDTDTAADVEQFFDKLNPFEEVAEQHGAGRLTEALTSIGIPGAYGFKLGSRLAKGYMDARKAGKLASIGRNKASAEWFKKGDLAKKLNKQAGTARFAAGTLGGATGEVFVADVEDIGSFGELFDSGPTRLDRWETRGREDAARKLMNRVKFGSESLLVTPFVAGAGKTIKAMGNKGKELAYSDSAVERWINKFVEAVTPEGALTKEVFGSQRVMEGFRNSDANRATELVKNLTRSIDKAFPQMQKVLDRSLTSKEKDSFLKEVNEMIFDGDVTDIWNPKKTNQLVTTLKNKGVDKNTSTEIVNVLTEARQTFSNLIDTVGKYDGQNELVKLLKTRIKDYTGNTYKIFEQNPILGIFGRYKPTDEVKEAAGNYFKNLLRKDNPKMASSTAEQESRQLVEKILEDGVKVSKSRVTVPDANYVKKTLEDMGYERFIDDVMDGTGAPNKVVKKLLGEMSDPRYSIFNSITHLSGMARMSAMLDEMGQTNALVQKEAGPSKGSFWRSEKEAIDATNGVADIVSVNKIMGELTKFRGGNLVNPLADMWTTRPMAEALARANSLKEGYFTAAVRGREGATGTEKGMTWLYRNLLLLPKATAQLAKTVLSIPTHLRNLLSAGAFAAANGILFEGLLNPKLLGQSFRKGWTISGVNPFRGSRFNDKEFEKAYRELLELGIVNSQVQIGDLKNLMRDVKFGDKIADVDAVLRPMMAKLKKVPEYLQGKYVAEDDFWKITNYFVELNRRNDAYKKAGINKPLSELKKEAADIVKNTVPNYSYVGEYVRAARLLPVGNFMSFPSEMIRTTTNIGEQAIKEMKHIPGRGEIIRGSDIAPVVYIEGKGFVSNNNPMYRIGVTRATGMAFTLGTVPTMMVEGAKTLYNVTEDEINALRQFVPEWSRNSTLIPIRDDNTGELKYIDFSHSNAYDLMSRPFRTLANEIAASTKDGDTILAGFAKGADEALTEVAAPFIDESIWTTAAADINLYPFIPGRGGRTKDGRILYTDQTSLGDKLHIKGAHLWKALEPGGFRQYGRMARSLTDTPTKTGEFLEGKTLGMNDQMLGLVGFRPVGVEPLKAMGFKIAEYQRGIREARREFTGGYFGLLKGGPIKPNDIIKRYVASNAARFNVQQEMFKNITAANILGTTRGELLREFRDRQISPDTYFNLQKGKFEPYYPSDDIQLRFAEIARDLGDVNVFNEVRPALQQIRRELSQLTLDDNFEINVSDYIEETEIQTPPLPQTVTSAQPNTGVITQGQNILNQGMNAQANLTANGLTTSENALLSEEEKQIRLRQRGITT